MKNIPISCLCLWLAQGCLFAGIRAQMWSDNVTVHHKIFCDISKRSRVFRCLSLRAFTLLYGNDPALALRNSLTLGVLTSPLCIACHLECVSAPQSAKRLESLYVRHRIAFEVVMCIFLPLLYECLCKLNCSPPMVDVYLFHCRPCLSAQTLLYQYVLYSNVSLLLLTWVACSGGLRLHDRNILFRRQSRSCANTFGHHELSYHVLHK